MLFQHWIYFTIAKLLPRPSDHEETFLHCVCDCRHSKIIWHKVEFLRHNFFYTVCATELIWNGTNSSHSILFLAALWWVWRNRNLICLYDPVSNIYNSADTIISALKNWWCRNFRGSLCQVELHQSYGHHCKCWWELQWDSYPHWFWRSFPQ